MLLEVSPVLPQLVGLLLKLALKFHDLGVPVLHCPQQLLYLSVHSLLAVLNSLQFLLERFREILRLLNLLIPRSVLNLPQLLLKLQPVGYQQIIELLVLHSQVLSHPTHTRFANSAALSFSSRFLIFRSD